MLEPEGKLAYEQASSFRDPPVPHQPQGCTHEPLQLALTWVLRIELGSSFFHGKHFTKEAISPASLPCS